MTIFFLKLLGTAVVYILFIMLQKFSNNMINENNVEEELDDDKLD